MKRSFPREEVRRLGYRVVYVPHSVVTDHIAAYNLVYGGRHFTAPNRRQQKKRNETLKIPLNQIWISKKYRKYEAKILFHELREIRYRRKGFSVKKAHEMAREDEKTYASAPG